ncbi:MAG: GntR family transcriptional regulator [Pseudomonadota bacterium]
MSDVLNTKRAGDTASIIYASLRQEILNGKIPHGALLSQLTLAKEFGTSRGPVREALQRLQQEQLVIARTNQRYAVAPFDIADYENLLCLKLLNMTVAIRVCAPLLSAEQLGRVAECVALMNNSVNVPDPTPEKDWGEDEWEKAYREFCLVVVEPAGKRTVALITQFLDNLQRYRSNFQSRLLTVLHKDDVQLVHLAGVTEAAQSGDGELASRLFADYFYRMGMLVMAGVAPRHDPAILRATMNALL